MAGLLGTGLAELCTAAPMNAADLNLAREAAAAARWEGPRVRGGGWLEWRLATPMPGTPAQFFDPAHYDLSCEFSGPQGRSLHVTAFWSRDPLGSQWVLRLLPPLAGRWRAAPRARIGGGEAVALGASFEFDVSSVVAHQRIVIDPQDPRYFAFDDGTPFVPVGLNVCWGAGPQPLADYRRWFTRLAENGGNFARLWMASWSFGIEWKDTGLGDYAVRMDRAAQLDAVFELAESLGIRIMLCLVNHGAFTEKNDAEWQDNPYNQANGGPLAAPEGFVTDERAQALFERRVRYIAARWAHSPALHSWEWWNEVTWTPIDAAQLRPWFTRMSRVLDAHDPYRRLRSTSWADRGDAASWKMPALDYAQQHDYTSRDLMLHYAGAAREWRDDGITSKPLVASELGLETTHDAKAPRPFNWDAVHLHNGLWAPLFHGFAATALYWWWDHLVDPLNVWPAYRGITRYLQALHDSGLRLAGHRPHAAEFAGGEAHALALAGPTSVLLWVRADLHDASALREAWQEATGGTDPARPWQPDYPAIVDGRVRVQGLALADGRVNGRVNGRVRVRWFDAGSGEALATAAGLATTETTLRDGALDLTCPSFGRDVAAIVQAL
ncbi:hypothetical protein [Aquabacterium sp.]|uniref:hypothetical protein n=1 Tax=Aquabacterium sp. TaxID=1872578 RepID=UPI002BE45135|nr:hypothetical protein [Aquabacterium sp.]HSW03518.1 hypothetical protein [Aquabacterium sp.]